MSVGRSDSAIGKACFLGLKLFRLIRQRSDYAVEGGREADFGDSNKMANLTSPLPQNAAGKSDFLGHILAVEINDFLPSRGYQRRSRSRVIPNILHLLDHIDKHRAEGNFYITPDVMKDFPEVVSLVHSRSHEIGLCLDFRDFHCPGSIGKYRDELRTITHKDNCGACLKGGYREGRHWLRQLAEDDFRYCLTSFHIGPDNLGSTPENISFGNNQTIYVVPPSAYRFFGMNSRFGEAGRIRLFPYWFLRRCMRHFTRAEIPALVNFPLWEFDPHLPRRALNPLQALKSYANLSLAEFKLTRLILDFDFVKVTRILGLEAPEKV